MGPRSLNHQIRNVYLFWVRGKPAALDEGAAVEL
jgi:hypothetical protein